MKEYKFSYKHVKSTPRKVRLVIDLVRKMNCEEALIQLKYLNKAAAKPVYELIKSAVASFKDKNTDASLLQIKSITCDAGPALKRRTYRSRGRAMMIKKRTSHINLVINQINSQKQTSKKAKTSKKDK